MTALLYLDDIAPGQVFERGSVTIQTPDIQAFAEKFDPQAFHLNEDAARDSIFGGFAMTPLPCSSTNRVWDGPACSGAIGAESVSPSADRP
jgi:acyl dehydratase